MKFNESRWTIVILVITAVEPVMILAHRTPPHTMWLSTLCAQVIYIVLPCLTGYTPDPNYNPNYDSTFAKQAARSGMGAFVLVLGSMAQVAYENGNNALGAAYDAQRYQMGAESDAGGVVDALGTHGSPYGGLQANTPSAKSLAAIQEGGCSFNAKTLVTTSEGEKAIVTILVGDQVLAWNQETGKTGYYTVTATHLHLDHTLVYLTIDSETILTTPEHPFFTEGGQWVGAGELRVGNRVKQIDGDLGTVRKVEVVRAPQVMYNLKC